MGVVLNLKMEMENIVMRDIFRKNQSDLILNIFVA